MISGDANVTKLGTGAHERFKLQAGAVEILDVLVWPKNSLFKAFFTSQKYDIVTSQDPFWRGLIAWAAARRFSARLNVQVHADLSGQGLAKRTLAQIVLRHANSVRVVSKRLKNDVEKLTKASVHILPVFVDVERFQNAVHKPHTQKTILWTGRFETEKDPLMAIEIFKEICSTVIGAKLVMLGEGSLKQELVRRAYNLPVEFPGWQSDVLPYIAVADVVLCTSPKESWGASIVEALAAGVPVVAQDVGIAKEAGAVIVNRTDFAQKVVEILKSGARGQLLLPLLNAKDWAVEWKKTL